MRPCLADHPSHSSSRASGVGLPSLAVVESEAVRQHALGRYGVGTIAIGQADLRIAFSCTELEQIEDLFAVIARSVRDLRAA